MSRFKIIILGKIPPPFFGTSVWFDILRNSSLNDSFNINWFNVNVHKDFSNLGKGNYVNIIPNIRLYFRFKKILWRFKPELVLIPISQSTPGFLKDSIFIRLARKRAKTLIILHGSNINTWLGNSHGLIKKYFTDTLKGTEGAIVLGRKLKYLFLPWYSDGKIHVISNGITMKKLVPLTRTSSEIIIRYIGSLSFNKGVFETIESIKLLKDSICNFKMVLNGKWRDIEFQTRCTNIIERYELPVFYEGEVTGDDKFNAYSTSDIFVFTPIKPEGFPMIIIEAMSFGLPIISTDQGAITEAVLDGVNGFIVKAGSAKEIAQKLKYLIENPTERLNMGKESLKLYQENFTEEKMIKNYTEVFNKILALN